MEGCQKMSNKKNYKNLTHKRKHKKSQIRIKDHKNLPKNKESLKKIMQKRSKYNYFIIPKKEIKFFLYKEDFPIDTSSLLYPMYSHNKSKSYDSKDSCLRFFLLLKIISDKSQQ